MLVSLDIYRPAAQEQLAQLAEQTGVYALPVIKGEKPAETTRRAISEGRKGGFDVIILDSAGRLHIDEELMNEVVEVKKNCQSGRNAAAGRCDDWSGFLYGSPRI